jgi:hypothetical protein
MSAAKRSRGKNFTADEDADLCRAWLAVSQDATAGTDQRAETFWGRVMEEFVAMSSGETRTIQSLQTRWSSLQANVSKFCGYLAAVKNEEHSGWSPENILKEALHRYADFRKSAFDSMACYEILKDAPKWHVKMLPKKKVAVVVDGYEEKDELEPFVSPSRPPGTKKMKRTAPHSAEKVQIHERKMELQMQSIAMKEKAIADSLAAARRNASLLEDQIGIGLFAMDPGSVEAQEFFALKRAEYLARARSNAK